MTAKKTLICLVASAALAMGFALGHGTETHENITSRALELLGQEDERFGCDVALFDVESLLLVGAAGEDEEISAGCADGALCEVRFLQHFLPRLEDGAGASTCSALQWGFGGGSCFQSLNAAENPLVNAHGWPAAVAAAGTEAGWEELGYLVHLLEDMSAPSHVRDDAHPHTPLAGDPLGAADPFEAMTLDVPMLPMGPIPTFGSAEAIFLALQEATQAAAFSQDTVFDSSLPGPASADDFATEKYVDGMNDPAAGEPFEDADYFYDGDGLRIARKGMDYVASSPDEFDMSGNRLRDLTLAEIDAAVVADQWGQLGPSAVLHVAALMQHYVDAAGGLAPCDITPPEITAVIDGTLGNNGWYVSDVTVSWIVEDPESGIAETTGCETVTLTDDTPGTTLTCTATNGVGLTSTESVTIKIDQTAPVVSGLPGDDCTLWPPNHKLVKVATVTASDNLSGLVSFDLDATSNEPEGRTRPDWRIGDDGSVWLRSERLGNGSGRVYTISARAEDAAGNVTDEQATCVVPHDNRRSSDFRAVRGRRGSRDQ